MYIKKELAGTASSIYHLKLYGPVQQDANNKLYTDILRKKKSRS